MAETTSLRKLLLFLLFLPLFLFSSLPLSAAVSVEALPEPLRPWVQWVLHDHEDERCPYLQGGDEERNCVWAGRLDLEMNASGGRFSQSWEIHSESAVPLPGDADHWPQEVRVGGQAAAVLVKDDKPTLFLKPGTYQVSGAFFWKKIPESFPIPPETGILHLTVDGQEKPFPQVDEGGLVWIRKEAETAEGENRLEMRVNRKLTDDIPFLLTTHLNIDVSGQNREIILEKVLPENFTAMSLDSPLPARLEAGGKLRVQVKPGNWRIEIQARHVGPLNALAFQEHGEPWPQEEIWVFEAQPNLRLVWVEGVPSIDPQQTTLPEEWKQLPAYRLAKGETLRLAEKRRGDSDPAPDQLRLHRDWWLDFNGGGFTLHDRIGGTFHRSWRLDMNAPVELGRISVDGKDQFITQLAGEKKRGVEIRQGRANVDADSRIPGNLRSVSAIGWEQNFQQVSGVLYLPPGWRAFSITGVDQAPETWMQRWTLWDFFLILITALAFFKLWGWRWGLVALVSFALIFPEPDGPRWIWLAVVAGFALLQVLPKGKIWSLVRFYKFATLLLLIGLSIPFMVRQLRIGVFPALEHPYQMMSNETYVAAAKPEAVDANVVPLEEPQAPAPVGGVLKEEKGFAPSEGSIVQQNENMPSSRLYFAKSKKGMEDYDQKMLNLQQQRPGTKVQTGPGLPRWSWNQVHLSWNGPVAKEQKIHFWLWSPLMNLGLAILRVGLLTALLLCLVGWWDPFRRRFLKFRPSALSIALFLGLAAWGAPSPARADFPPKELLDELRERLLEAPLCHPDCASFSRALLTVTPTHLQIRLDASSQSATAVPLPGNAKEWTPLQVLLDGQAASGLTRNSDGTLWLNLSPGAHQVLLEGPLPDRETVQISLPLKPYHAEAQASGWSLDGIDEDGVPEDNLQLTRLADNQATAALRGSGEPSAALGLPPFVLVEREITLGLTWEVVTRVVRVTPAGVPVVLEVPLLAGESVVTPDIRVEKGKVMVNMSPAASDLEWRSVLKETPKLELKANGSPNWMEVWRLNAGPIWHVTFTGIPYVHPENPESSWLPEWRPWPGETLAIDVSRPEGVAGQTLTIDQSTMKVTPGLRFTETVLNLTLRSSLGGQHVLTLPAGADLQSVAINGQVQPIRMDQGKLTLPIAPGSQTVEIRWQQSNGIRWLFRSPAVDLGSASVNSEIQFNMPASRWILYAGGPRMGPAVQFWSLLAVILLFSIGLSKTGLTPMGIASWFLLGIGISQFPKEPVVASLFVSGWLLLLGWSARRPDWKPWAYDLRQLFLVFYTVAALIILFIAIYQGLLGMPEMQIAGNGSNAEFLRWFQDRSGPLLPRPWVLSVPLYIYRLAMLAWALWIAWALLAWLKWGWKCLSTGGLWKPLGILKKKSAPQ